MRRIPIDKVRATVSVTTSRREAFGAVSRTSRWSLELGDEPTLEFDTQAYEDGCVHDDEAFAQALADRIGWTLPAETRGDLADAA